MKEESSSLGGTRNNWYSAVNKYKSDTQRKSRISFRVSQDLLRELEAQEVNRSEAIRKALRSEYGDSDGY